MQGSLNLINPPDVLYYLLFMKEKHNNVKHTPVHMMWIEWKKYCYENSGHEHYQKLLILLFMG